MRPVRIFAAGFALTALSSLLQPALSRRTRGLFRCPTPFGQERAAPADSQLPGYLARQGFGRVMCVEQPSRPSFCEAR